MKLLSKVFTFLLLITIESILNLSMSHGALLEWNTFGNSGTETSELSFTNDIFLHPSQLTLGPGILGDANGNRFGGRSWFDTGDTVGGTTLAESIAGNDYLEFVASPVSGYSFTPTSFVFNWERSGTGPGSVALRSSFDGFANNLGTLTGLPTSLTTGNSISISGLVNLMSPVTFRLYGFGATASAGTGGFDTSSNTVNVRLNGSTAAVPEPSSALFILAGVLVLTRHCRRIIS